MPADQRRKSNVLPFRTRDQLDTERGFSELAEAAARGDLLGGGYSVVDRNGELHQGLLGIARSKPELTHYGAARLAHMLLWPDDQKSRY